MSAEVLLPVDDDVAEYLRSVMDEHQPGRHGWCRCCGLMGCRRGRDAAVELAIAGRLEIPAPWTVRPEPGRWP